MEKFVQKTCKKPLFYSYNACKKLRGASDCACALHFILHHTIFCWTRFVWQVWRDVVFWTEVKQRGLERSERGGTEWVRQHEWVRRGVNLKNQPIQTRWKNFQPIKPQEIFRWTPHLTQGPKIRYFTQELTKLLFLCWAAARSIHSKCLGY